MRVSPFPVLSSLYKIAFGFFKRNAFQAFCALGLFLWSSQFNTCAIFVALLSAIDFSILSVSRCECYGFENGDNYVMVHRSKCKYGLRKPNPYVYGLAVFLNQNYHIFVVILAMYIGYFF